MKIFHYNQDLQPVNFFLAISLTLYLSRAPSTFDLALKSTFRLFLSWQQVKRQGLMYYWLIVHQIPYSLPLSIQELEVLLYDS